MTHLANFTSRLRADRMLLAPALAAVLAVAALLAMLARPEAVLRLALDGALVAGTASQGRTTPATARAPARVTVSETGDLVERAADPHALSPVLTTNDATRPAVAVFAVGDRFTVGANGSDRRTLEVVDVSDGGPTRLAVHAVDGARVSLNLVLVTCRVLDAAGVPVAGETVRFLAAAEPRPATLPLVQSPATL